MITLNADECRVLGVLVEKAHTVPDTYPMTVNAVVNGCNQKNNRLPVLEFTEERALDALDGLRRQGLAHEVMLSGSRVNKYRHMAREILEVDTSQLVVLTELLLRGPQTLGELRGNASRMHTLESLEVTQNVLKTLMDREEPMVRQIAPAPGSRAPRFVQLMCPDLHPIEVGTGGAGGGGEHLVAAAPSGLESRVKTLENEVGRLKEALSSLARSLGEADPLGQHPAV